jgi:hypothetical protein
MQHHTTRTAFGAVLGHPSKPNLRFFTDTAGAGGGGAGAGAAGAAADAAGGAGAAGAAGGAAAAAEEPLSAEDAKAVRATADKAMRERNTARDEAKAFKDLGLTLEEITDLKAKRDAANGGPTPEQVQKDADKRADAAASEKFSAKARQSSVREQATLLGFHDPAVALALLNPTELAKVTVSDDLEPDAAAVKGLLMKLSTAQPYLLKTPGQQTVDYRTAGIGGAGGSAKPDPGPGTPRMAAAYATPAGQ